MKSLVLKKCNNCGAIVEVIKDCNCDNCGIMCCDTQMSDVKSNNKDFAFEKHIPTYKKVDDKIEVSVNHDMIEEHHIEWLMLLADDVQIKKQLTIGSPAKAIFPYIKGAKIYSYCNKHGLWESVVE